MTITLRTRTAGLRQAGLVVGALLAAAMYAAEVEEVAGYDYGRRAWTMAAFAVGYAAVEVLAAA